MKGRGLISFRFAAVAAASDSLRRKRRYSLPFWNLIILLIVADGLFVVICCNQRNNAAVSNFGFPSRRTMLHHLMNSHLPPHEQLAFFLRNRSNAVSIFAKRHRINEELTMLLHFR